MCVCAQCVWVREAGLVRESSHCLALDICLLPDPHLVGKCDRSGTEQGAPFLV